MAADEGDAVLNVQHLAIIKLMQCAGKSKMKYVVRIIESMPIEIEWRIIPDFPAYEASSTGKIRRFVRGSRGVRVLKEVKTNRDGRTKVTLYNADGKQVSAQVHRIICVTWHGAAPKDRPFACHRNGNNLDNYPANLYWGTASENSQDSVRHGTNHYSSPENFVQSPYTRHTVAIVRKAYHMGIIDKDQAIAEVRALRERMKK